MTTDYEPRILVRDKHKERYALWIYETDDWTGDTYYTASWEIVAFAYTPEERNALNATVEYHTRLMKEMQDAND